eukprot:3320400-Alexandrium_andersonii.AAC.1
MVRARGPDADTIPDEILLIRRVHDLLIDNQREDTSGLAKCCSCEMLCNEDARDWILCPSCHLHWHVECDASWASWQSDTAFETSI